MKFISPYFICHFALLYIAATFPFSFQISNLGIGLLVLVWLYEHISAWKKPKILLKGKVQKLILVSYLLLFGWQLFSLLYANNIGAGLKALESKLSLLILPLVLYTIQFNRKSLILAMKTYSYSILVCTIVLLARSTYRYLQTQQFLTYHDFVGLLDFHAVFYSYYVFLAILFGLYLFQNKLYSRLERKLFGLSIAFFFVGLLFAASKNVLLVSLLTFGVYWVLKAVKKHLSIKKILISASGLVVAVFVISQIPAIQGRMSELTSFRGLENIEKVEKEIKLTHEDRGAFNGTSIRLFFWHIGIEELSEHNRWLIGLNPADRRQVINERFYEIGMNPWFENYNLHNQFIQTLVELGLIGLFIYLLLHLFYFVYAIKNKDAYLLVFLSVLVVFQVTESLLERNKGIVFMVFFLLFFQQLNQLKHEVRDSRD